MVFSAAFGGSWFWPLLGILFLPFTTLMYVLLWSATGLTSWDWFWLFLAVLIDVGAIVMRQQERPVSPAAPTSGAFQPSMRMSRTHPTE